MKRRSFLQGLVAAPVAAPVIARDAAEKAGLGNLGGSLRGGTTGLPAPPIGSGGELDWVKKMFSASFEDEVRQSTRVYYLDPDLASSRSLSLVAAVRIQKEREVQRSLRERRRVAADTYERITGQEWPL